MNDAHTHKRRSLLRRTLGRLYRGLQRSMPENRFGDRLVACVRFVVENKRLPTASLTYNDVLYRIKTSNEILDPLRVFVSDKEFVKVYVKAIVGDEYNVPTIGVIRREEDVDAYPFPPDCCIKPTHASGRVILRRHGAPIDSDKIRSWFHTNYYHVGREANYRMLTPKVIVEPLIFEGADVEDYKVFCLNGTPRMIQVDVDRRVRHKRKYFDAEWNELDFSIKYPRTDKIIPRPDNLAEMLTVAGALSRAFGLVRVDLYSDGTRLLVGEITHVPDNAGGRSIPAAAETLISECVFGKTQSAAGESFAEAASIRSERARHAEGSP
jgi:TupA-like ATPgrasp